MAAAPAPALCERCCCCCCCDYYYSLVCEWVVRRVAPATWHLGGPNYLPTWHLGDPHGAGGTVRHGQGALPALG